MLFQRCGIIDEIGFAERYGHNAPSGNRHLQTTRDGFNFRKLWHKFA